MSLSYDDNIGPTLKKPSFSILGVYNMSDNKFNQYRTEVCSEIEKNDQSLFVAGHQSFVQCKYYRLGLIHYHAVHLQVCNYLIRSNVTIL